MQVYSIPNSIPREVRQKVSKLIDIKNAGTNEVDIYIYGEIVSGSEKWDESDVTFNDFKDVLENLTGSETVNLYVNSLGGSVFATQGMIALLQRAKAKGVIINATIDGVGASCASFLPLVADNVYAYNSSIIMVHKPFIMIWGNADDMMKEAEVLEKIEDSVMMPIYMKKAKEGVTENQLKDLIRKETWLNSKEMSEIFDITILEENKELVACVDDKSIVEKYKNMPKHLKDKLGDIDNSKIEEIKAKKLQEEREKQKIKLAQAKLRLSTI